ncbi:histidine--tRNA ligase [Coprococcus sp. CAG:782]|jgi:histidyl-tRNA synthetase|uniref:histidine--tRNA ligase n=1 Tax=Coprococcus sp. OM04-5BH TaxID=2293093 RepID=UPI00033899E5|nr:histidine--tRNA ligase [Coprococcus sp. OM04-5BH]MEE0035135.1 histidine--tRNA ligase [Coprococcus sp.]RHV34512.1 histidine--tRNA ligase [Coprococcus sp. OM04-5BH]CCY53018.1 histidine--tRNA ligase [Coprococcus sp. CAG:782]
MAIITPRTLSGFMELAPKDQILFEKVKQKLEETYQMFGFFPIDTPVLEHSNILLAKAGGETEKQIYRFNKGDTDMTMRFDLTVPLAKYVAKNAGELTFPFKRYQIGKVYRGERAQQGRFREFYQADIDIIGDENLSIANDAEVPSIMYRVFTGLGLSDFTIRINNRKILNGLFAMLGLSDIATDVMRIIDKIDKIGKDNVEAELVDLGVSKDAADTILELLTFKGTNEEVLDRLKTFAGKNEMLDSGVSELCEVIYYIDKFGVPAGNYRVDLSIARGLDYYTGTVYETTFNRHPEIGSICSGGRYDNLAEYYTKKKLPGVGMSIGLTRLFYILNEFDYLNRDLDTVADLLIIPMTDDMASAVEISGVMREAGIRTQIYLEKKKFKHKIGYADKLGIPYAMFLGEDEINGNVVTIKNMKAAEGDTDKQVTVPVNEAVEFIKSGLAKNNSEKCIKLGE